MSTVVRFHFKFKILTAVVALFFTSEFHPALASSEYNIVAGICDRAAIQVSHETGVPVDVLRAISLTETGRNGKNGFLPWPWTVNMEGIGKWFNDRETAQAYVDRNFERGARSFDVGCFQINYRWHGQAFNSIQEMFEPVANARYAADFLQRLYYELGDWTKAAGAYHSRTPKFANKYKKRFSRIRADLKKLPGIEVAHVQIAKPEPQVAETIERINRFPLLVNNGPTASASLVPLSALAPLRLIDISSPRALLEIR